MATIPVRHAGTAFVFSAILLGGLVLAQVSLWDEAQIDITTSGGFPLVDVTRQGDLEAVYYTVMHAVPGVLLRAAYVDVTPFNESRVDFYATGAGGLERLLAGERPAQIYHEVPDGARADRFFTITVERAADWNWSYRRAGSDWRLTPSSVDFVWIHNRSQASHNFTLNDSFVRGFVQGSQQHLLELYPNRVDQMNALEPVQIAAVALLVATGGLWAWSYRKREAAGTEAQPDILGLLARGESHLRSLRAALMTGLLVLLAVAVFGWYLLEAAFEAWEWPNRLPSNDWPDRIHALYVVAQLGLLFWIGVRVFLVDRELRRWRQEIASPPPVA